MSTKRLGFMMRDLLVLIVIVAIAVPLFVLAPVQKVRDGDGRRLQHINNLKQMNFAIHNFNDVYKRLPPATGTFGDIKGGNRSLSVHLLPFVEQNSLYVEMQKNQTVSTAVIPPYTSPFDFTTLDFQRVQNYPANVRVFTDLGINTPYNADVVGITPSGNEGWNTATLSGTFKDGTSNVIMFGSRYANNGTAWGGGNVNCSAYDAWIGKNNSAFFGVSTMTSAPTANSTGGWQLAPTVAQANCQFGVVGHSFGKGGILVGLADGSVRTVAPSVSPFTWNAAMQPNDGNALGTDW